MNILSLIGILILEINQPAPFPYCASSLGWFGLSDECQRSDIDRLGLGISIYFKTLKALMIAFLAIFLLNMVTIYFFFSYQNTKMIFTPDSILSKFTIGNISSGIKPKILYLIHFDML